MWWAYLLVFVGALAVDVVPLPLPPAFTVMILFQILFGLNIWLVITIGVAGSIAGRYMLTLYISRLSIKMFSQSKNEDVQYLGDKLKQKGWKCQAAILVYSLMPLPTTPLFIASGMAKIKSIYIIPPFIIGKFISDMIAVLLGKYAAENVTSLADGMISWQAISGLIVGMLLVFLLLFVDWRSLFELNKFALRFRIMK